MSTILAVLVAASQMTYEAKVTTFGCNSTGEVFKLQSLRSDKDAFDKQLYTQIVYGECIAIAQGQLLDGSIMDTDSSLLRVGVKDAPPGFIAPVDDFQLKAEDEKLKTEDQNSPNADDKNLKAEDGKQ